MPNIHYHEVEVSRYPLFEYPPYDLALATRMAEVAEMYELDLLHVHYAIPHSVSAMLARQMLACDHHRKGRKLPYVTTLHGTDITLVGADPSYLPITRFSIEQSDGVTSISQYLARTNVGSVRDHDPIKVIPNFVNCDLYHRTPEIMQNRSEYANARREDSGPSVKFPAGEADPDVIEIFDRVQKKIPARLMMIGDGPERSRAEWLAVEKGIHDKVDFLGKQDRIHEKLPLADVMLLPSELESFGLAALEAMACQVVPIATNAGGVPEVIRARQDGISCRRSATWTPWRTTPSKCCRIRTNWKAWEIAARPARRRDSAPARSFPCMKITIARCWNAPRRSRRRPSRPSLPPAKPAAPGAPACRAGLAFDGDLGRVSVHHLQALGHIHHADPGTRRVAGSAKPACPRRRLPPRSQSALRLQRLRM